MINEIMLTQKNRLKLSKDEFDIITKLSYHSARLYNVGLYSVRQYFFLNNEYLPYVPNYHACKDNENYKLLLSDTSQQILRIVDRNFKSFFNLIKLKAKGKYSAKIRTPRYKKETELMNITIQGRSARIKNGYVHIGFSKAFKDKYQPTFKELIFKLPKNITVTKLQEVRILPVFNGKEFDIEFIYKKQVEQQEVDITKHLSCDLGLNNFATCFNSVDGSSFILDGRYIKSVNHRYNKEIAKLQSIKDKQNYTHKTNRMFNLTRKRTNRINETFNQYVKFIIDYCIKNKIGTLVIGNFKAIKQEINLGKKNNQNFVQIPYGIFKRKLQCKCEQFGIEYYTIEESYTSKCSFLDNEAICKHDSYLGTRIKRGLFRTTTGILVNADTNGSANILRKFLKSTHRLEEFNFGRVVKGFVNNPQRIRFSFKANSFQAHEL